MDILTLACLLALGAVVTAFKPAWAEFCLRIAGVAAVAWVVVQIVRAIL